LSKSRKADTVDDLLEGFGPARSDLPRVVRNKDTTPPPDPPGAQKKELASTEPGARQRQRNIVLALLVSFVVVALGGLAILEAAR
jgi:hypothetical protein